MRRPIKAVAISILALLLLVSCGEKPAGDGRLRVVVTVDALYEFAVAVGGERVNVTSIIPAGSEPHDYEPKPRDLESLAGADVFLYSGLGLEPWAEETIATVKNAKLTSLDMSVGIELISDGGGGYDPHTWLSLINAVYEVQRIAQTFAALDPGGADVYDANAEAFEDAARNLDDIYLERFESAGGGEFVTGHEAFAYLCRDYGLTQRGVSDMYAEGEPSAKQLAELIEFCRDNGIKTVFAESTAPSNVAETLARECGALVKTIYTIETAEGGLTYLERMAYNLEQISGG
jgi:zinc transport system substrate-binding protein